MLVSEVAIADATWTAAGPMGQDGSTVELDGEELRAWSDRMMVGAALLFALNQGPRRLVVFHADGWD